MSCFTVQVLEPSGKIIEIETHTGNKVSSVILENRSSPNISLSECIAQLPSDFGDRVLSTVSGNLPVKNIIGGSGISIQSSSGDYVVAVTGNFGLTGEEVDDRVNNLLTAGSYVNLNYNDSLQSLNISVTGLQPSGNYSLVGHSHISSDITDFNSGVSGLLPVKNITAGNGISISNTSGDFTVAVTGNFGLTSEQVDDRISNLLVGTDHITLSYEDNFDKLIIGTSGLQPSGDYSLFGHSHQISDVSGLQNILDNKQPSGNYAQLIHTHLTSDIINFVSGVNYLVSGFYATLDSPNLTGIPTAPTATINSNSTQIANTAFVRNEISNLVNSAPSTLDTLNELALALGNDANFSTTIASGLAQKSNIGHAHASSDITNFNSSVSGLLPIINITGLSGIIISNSGTTYNVSSSGLAFVSGANFNSLSVNGVTVSTSGHLHSYTDISNWASGIDQEVHTLLVGGNNINIVYDGVYDTLTINASGLQPSGSYSSSNHSHGNISNSGTIGSTSGMLVLTGSGGILTTDSGINSSYITNLNSTVSGLLPVKNLIAGTGISIYSSSGDYTINSTGSGVLADQSSALVTTVFNKTGSPIPKMSAVYINGGQGDQPTVALAIATGDPTSAGTYGVAFETIPNMSTGKIVVFGALTGLNTDQFNPTAPHGDVNGQVLYLSPTIAGGLTLTKPSAPNHIVAIGTIVRTHQNEGVIEVRVQNGFELEELHNVAISDVTDGQFLQYNSGSGLWVPTSSGNFSTLLVNGSGVSLVGHSHTSSDINDFNSSVSGLLPVTNITGGSNITVSQSGTIYTVAVTGSLGLTTEEVDDRVSNLLVAGTGIGLSYDDNANTLTIAVSGLSSTAKIGDGIGEVITYNLSDPLNIVGSGSTTIDYNNVSKTVTIGSPSLIREYELISSTKSAFSVTGGYALNNLDVYHNGIKLLASGDYTATNGSSFTLVQPAVSGDVVEWLGYSVVPRSQLILGEVRSDTVGNVNYLGRAVAGSSEASTVWTVKKYIIADNGIDITTSTASNIAWTDHLSATYV